MSRYNSMKIFDVRVQGVPERFIHVCRTGILDGSTSKCIRYMYIILGILSLSPKRERKCGKSPFIPGFFSGSRVLCNT